MLNEMKGKRKIYGFKNNQKSRILIAFSDFQEFTAINVLSREGYINIKVVIK